MAEVASYTEWLALPADDRARRRYVLLSHHEDPITRFEPALIVQEPGWLGPAADRPPGISRLACWYPLTTFVLTLVDVKNAMSVTPGRFAARGHDYRADLARMVSQAYGLPATDGELLATEAALRRREAEWGSGGWSPNSCAWPGASSGRPGTGAWPRTPSPPAPARPDRGGWRPARRICAGPVTAPPPPAAAERPRRA